jgi:hypothetical protein
VPSGLPPAVFDPTLHRTKEQSGPEVPRIPCPDIYSAARAGEDAIAGTGSHGRGRLQHLHPATRARTRPQAMIKTCFPQATPPDT